MGTMREYRERKAQGEKVLFYWGIFVIFFMIPILFGLGAIFK